MLKVALYARYSTIGVWRRSSSSAPVVSMRAGKVGRSSIPIGTPPSPAPASFSDRMFNRYCRTASAASSTSCSPKRWTAFRAIRPMWRRYLSICCAGVQIVTLAEGEISELHVGPKGTTCA